MISSFRRTFFIVLAAIVSVSAIAQKDIPHNWHFMDQKTTGYYGISLDKAYEFVASKNLKSSPVVVAVIDTGIDTTHEDLKPVLWTNPKEIPGNGIDDDKNGYVDDVHGWNFIGGKDGRNVSTDSYEVARVYHQYKDKYKDQVIDESKLSPDELYTYKMWKRAEAEINSGQSADGGVDIIIMRNVLKNIVASDSVLKKALGKDVYTGKELKAYSTLDIGVKKAKNTVLGLMEGNDMLESTNKEFIEGFSEYIDSEVQEAEKKEEYKNPPKNYRDDIVKDNYDDFNDKFYGNNDIMANTPLHGTHVAGLIGAVRNNGKGVDGIADNVRIMAIRTLADGDEHDKDVALAIRYAVDNGAQIINMSFGKAYSPEKKWVDDAIRYADTKGVLLVHAAGNDGADIDTVENYPNPYYLDNKKASNILTVGASGDPKIGGLTASFSNYGKKEVDVFAPGVRIYSTVPGGNTYGYLDGTSFSSPIVAGTAAFLLSYYPTLSAKQLKEVIEKSAQKLDAKVVKPGSDEMVSLSDISKTGGLVNVYEAAKLASTIKGERNATSVKPTSTVNPKTKG